MIGKALDKFVGVFSPVRAVRRMQARVTMAQIDALSSSNTGGYEAGAVNRLNRYRGGSVVSENGIPSLKLQNIRAESWRLYRDNPHARKIVRTLETRVVGCGVAPQSMACDKDGKPLLEFRQLARQLWNQIEGACDFRGRPGYGGQSLTELAKITLRSVILNGDGLFRGLPVSAKDQMANKSPIPWQLQVIDANRLLDQDLGVATASVEIPAGHVVLRGIELDANGRVSAYYLREYASADPREASSLTTVRRVASDKITHLFVREDAEQVRGAPWFASAVRKMAETGDYEENELTAAAMSACVAMGIRRPSGTTSTGLELPSEWSLQDGDGNNLTALQPGMIMDLGKDGALEPFNPLRPNAGAAEFIGHMLRTTAASQPGIKSSTLTGDYRRSSFSSERSADNDAWPEIQGVQEWFYRAFYQNIYEQVIAAAVLSGYFDGVVTPAEYAADPCRFHCAKWQGPVSLSINPTDDAKAAGMRIENGTSSLQLECAKLGLDWREILKHASEFIDVAEEMDLPEELVYQFLGLDPQIVVAEEQAKAQAEAAAAQEDAAAKDPAAKKKPVAKGAKSWVGPNGEDLSDLDDTEIE